MKEEGMGGGRRVIEEGNNPRIRQKKKVGSVASEERRGFLVLGSY